LYPQWSKGQQVSSEKGTFTQPFSQVFAGTPIVRLRIGDVIKSNYSKFNLARLFGVGDSETEFKNKGEVNTGLTKLRGAVNKFADFLKNLF